MKSILFPLFLLFMMISILHCILKDCSSPFKFLFPCRLTRLKVSPSKLLVLTWSNPVSLMGNCMLPALELAQEEIFMFWLQKIRPKILCIKLQVNVIPARAPDTDACQGFTGESC
ncbi:hypothetical protein LAZ67_8000987 [Cordylochernes scorpioides]|uniref:Uncharacterized protein n=1 Tax=Cordylochernes scorpioides TaxID=51811 RepID=A0ABY6KT25_9ARAC|nr:hypothetical protein LAZ67_8000987 [Cordylochernes scorpioides]